MMSVIAYIDVGGFAAYVAASRATCCKSLYLANRVTLGDLNKHLPPDLIDEMKKIDSITWNSSVTYGFQQGSLISLPSCQCPYPVSYDEVDTDKSKGTKRKWSDEIADNLLPDGTPIKWTKKNPAQRKRKILAVNAETEGETIPSKKLTRCSTLLAGNRLCASTYGCSWDVQNWSCMYNLALTVLYYIFHSAGDTWQSKLRSSSAFGGILVHCFTEKPFKQISRRNWFMNAIRDTVQDILSWTSPSMFLRYGEEMIAITDVLDQLTASDTNDVVLMFSCNLGCRNVIPSWKTSFSGVCSPHVWSLMHNPPDGASSGTLQQWLCTCLDGYGFLSSSRMAEAIVAERNRHALACSGYMTWTEVFVSPPMLLAFQIYSEYALMTRISLELQVPLVNSHVFYCLAGIVYHTGSHFTARLFLPTTTCQYNGQINDGKLEEVDAGSINLCRWKSGKAHVILYCPVT